MFAGLQSSLYKNGRVASYITKLSCGIMSLKLKPFTATCCVEKSGSLSSLSGSSSLANLLLTLFLSSDKTLTNFSNHPVDLDESFVVFLQVSTCLIFCCFYP